jgi:hypothetical protein
MRAQAGTLGLRYACRAVGAKCLDLAAQMNQDERVPEPDLRAGDLLAGPRGRELCARLAGMAVPEIRDQLAPPSAGGSFFSMAGPSSSDPPAVAEPLNQQDEERPAAEFDRDDQLAVIPALADVAEDVNYWGRLPDADGLDDPAVIAGLRTIAARVAGSAGCRWWWSPLDRSAQRYVQWAARDCPAPGWDSAAEMLRRADLEAEDLEDRMSRDRHLAAGSGAAGPWWSHPPRVISTTRRLGRLGALLLAGQEDGFGDTEAVVWPLEAARTARVFEIDGPGAWQRLVAAYPRTATAACRHTWAWTGWDGEWLLPRWPAVARDWDGVHLSVAGYLAAAGRALPVGTARTLLAGWNPDETYWLADVLTAHGQARAWHNTDRSPLGWQERTATS